MTASRPLRRDNAADRSTIARLAALSRWQGTTPEERSEDARKRGESTYAKHGKVHFVRMNLKRQGRIS